MLGGIIIVHNSEDVEKFEEEGGQGGREEGH